MKVIWLFLVVLILSPTSALADDFNVVGPACAPAHSSLGKYWVSGYTLRQSGVMMSTANVVFYCSIPQEITAPSHVYLLYSSTENHSGTFVKAHYTKVHKSTGAVTTVSTASSQTGINNGTVKSVQTTFFDGYDPTTYVYYVRVEMDRRNSVQDVSFLAVTVW